MNSSKAREQKPDLRDDKHAVNALIERQTEFRYKEFHGRKAAGKTEKRIQRRQLGRNVVSIDTEVREKGEGKKLYLWGMEGIRNADAMCEMFKLGCELCVKYKIELGLSGVLAITAVVEDVGRCFANSV